MRVDILSLFPNTFKSVLQESMMKRAQEKGLLDIHLHDIREHASTPHAQVDERPYGGGPGMVMMPGPLTSALESVRSKKSKTIYFSPQGRVLDAKKSRELASEEHLIFLCGHYEGIDQRIIEEEVDEEISIGDFVLTNGCLPALVTLDAVMRFLPGVVGHAEGVAQDSFENELFDCPHYTRPETFKGRRVPEVLLSGDHKKIKEWRYAHSLANTKEQRPDLYYRHLSKKLPKERDSDFAEATLDTLILPVTSLTKSLHFYRNVLKLNVEDKDSESAMLQLSDGTFLLLHTHTTPPSLSLSFTLSYRKESSVLQCLSRLKKRAHPFTMSAEGEPLSLQLSDPDGHQWKVYGVTNKQHKHTLEEIIS